VEHVLVGTVHRQGGRTKKRTQELDEHSVGVFGAAQLTAAFLLYSPFIVHVQK
jgi:hypothetical protein